MLKLIWEKVMKVENVKVELLDPSTGETAYLYYKDTSTSTGR